MPQLTIYPPPKHSLKVKPGDKLKPGDIITQAEENKSAKLNIAELLQIKPDKLDKHLLVKANENVKLNQLIAQKKGLFSSTTIKSPISGTMKLLKQPGFVLIHPANTSTTICPCNGTVTEISSSSVIINSDKLVIVGSSGQGNGRGELVQLSSGGDFYDVDDRFKGKIVISVTFKPAVLAKMKALGVRGVIADSNIPSSSLPFVVINKISDLTGCIGQEVQIFNEGDSNYILTV